MATVNKDFRVKNGLVVEGTTATVNGNDILTTASNTGNLPEGANLYFTDARAVSAVENAASSGIVLSTIITENVTANDSLTLTSNFGNINLNTSLGNVRVNDVNVATVNDLAANTDELSEGSSNLYFTDARAIAAVSENLTLNNLSDVNVNPSPGDYLKFSGNEWVVGTFQSDVWNQFSYNDGLSFSEGLLTITATTDQISEGSANQYFTTGRVSDFLSQASDITLPSTVYFGQPFSISAFGSDYGISNNSGAIAIVATGGIDLVGSSVTIDSAPIASEAYVNTAVSNLVDSAPAVLDTLNELAAALGDDPNFATTITTAIGEKVAKSGDTMTGFLTLHADPTNALHAATKQYVDAAVSSGIGGIDTDAVPEGSSNLYFTDERAQDAVGTAITGGTQTNITVTYDDVNNVYNFVAENGVADSTTDDLTEGSTNLYFTDARAVYAVQSTDLSGLTYNDGGIGSTQAKTLGFHYPMSSGTTKNVFQFSASEYSSAKIVIQARETQGSYEVSEFLVLHNGTDVYITEYANISSNSSIFDLTASLDSGNIQVSVTSAGNLGDFGVNGYATLLSLPAFS